MFVLWAVPKGVKYFTSSDLDEYNVRLVLEYIFHLFLTEHTATSAVSTSMSQVGLMHPWRKQTVKVTPWRAPDGSPVEAHRHYVEFLDNHVVECSAEVMQAYSDKWGKQMWWCSA